MSNTGSISVETANRVNNLYQAVTNTKLKCTKKCWICFNLLELERIEATIVQKLFMAKDLQETNKKLQKNVQLKVLFNKYVFSVCKCRKKLAHKECFNNFIDLKQNGNIKLKLICSQCNYKYEFIYPYNGVLLNLFDMIDTFLDKLSSLSSIGIFFTSLYWFSLSYGTLSVVQVYGYAKGLKIIQKLNIIGSVLFLPIIPTILVSSRFISWQEILEKYFPKYFQYKNKSNTYKRLVNRESISEGNINDEKEDAQFLLTIRRILGGLLLPTISVSLDRLIFGFQNENIHRTILVGIAYIGIKGLTKIVYNKKKHFEHEHREIQDYSDENNF